MRDKPGFVVDSSIAHAAGESVHPVSSSCRNFLEALRLLKHPLVMSAPDQEEWGRHASLFAKQWRASMVARRLFVRVAADENRPLRTRIETCATRSAGDEGAQEGIGRAMAKDIHLIEAALHADHRVAALDDRVRGYFARCSEIAPPLADVHWVNPTVEAEGAIAWVQAGAETDASRMLKNWLPDERIR